MPFKGDIILQLDVNAHKSLSLFPYKKLQGDNLLHTYNEPMNIYSVVKIVVEIVKILQLPVFFIYKRQFENFDLKQNQ